MRARTRRNAIAGLWDAPPWRDWAAWQVLWWVFVWVLIVVPIPTDETTVRYPWWVNLIGGFFVLGFLAILPPLIRLWLRRAWAARRRRREYKLLTQPTDPHLRRPAFDPVTPVDLVHANRPAPIPERTEPPDPAPTPEHRPTPEPTPSPEPGPERARPREPAPATQPGTSTPGIRPVTVPDMPAELAAVRERFPYPVAEAARTLQFAADPRAAYDALLDLTEVLITCLGSVVAAVYHARSEEPPALQALHEAYLTRGVSLGHWLAVFRSARDGSAAAAAVPGLLDCVARRKGGALPEQLDRLVQERNRSAHGGRPQRRADAVERITLQLPTLGSALRQAQFLAATEWVLVMDSDYRRASASFRIRAERAMGEHPHFGSTEFETAEPLEDDVLYLQLPTHSVPLSPFVVVRECATCRRAEMFHSDRLVKDGAVLKAFGTAHDLRDPELVAELRTLTSAPSR